MRRSHARFLQLAVLLPVLVTGCGRRERFPTAVLQGGSETGAAALKASVAHSSEDMRDPGPGHLPRSPVIVEAKEALGALLTGEQTYYQREATFTNVAGIAEIRAVLGVDLSSLSHRWAFSVSEASMIGFVATARGRAEKAAGIVVTLHVVRGQPYVLNVTHPRRHAEDPIGRDSGTASSFNAPPLRHSLERF